jgi:hypothetical protein
MAMCRPGRPPMREATVIVLAECGGGATKFAMVNV